MKYEHRLTEVIHGLYMNGRRIRGSAFPLHRAKDFLTIPSAWAFPTTQHPGRHPDRFRTATSPSCPILLTAAMHYTPLLHAIAPCQSRRLREGPLAYRNADSSPAPDNEAGRRRIPLICRTCIRPMTPCVSWDGRNMRPGRHKCQQPVAGEPSGPPASHVLTQCNPADRQTLRASIVDIIPRGRTDRGECRRGRAAWRSGLVPRAIHTRLRQPARQHLVFRAPSRRFVPPSTGHSCSATTRA